MLFRKYHIVVFKDKQGSCRKLQMRGWVMFTLFFLMVGLGAGNIILWNKYINQTGLEKTLSMAEKTVQEQKTQLLSLSQKINALQKSLSRIRDFDSKLRVMINLDQESAQTASAKGGSANENFSDSYLPLYRQELLARKMHDFLHQLSVEARLEEVRQQEIVQSLRTKQDILEATPSIWPTSGWVTSPFAWRTSPFTGKREFHKGIDISAPRGTPIYAPARGMVQFAGHDGSYGLHIRLKHNSSLTTRYGHMNRLAVKVGQTVTRGELIGYVGNTGRSTGPHLHYEVRLNGVPVNPKRYILN
ncbi:M23 family metallopeptidase [Pseudodesulfovibrio senegalensis]|jgi:murein DD-endopeptidase MepM/ murein hydrolase activator NlpD|uniref:Peptidoglycan DD-metalloendopeptidase family protein n=1 Tax=Pseudodesulfovibrio senegalensis TaxID=1721087 RepID=A0A6N6N7J7_9BACT|nr:M23 family metallopeptidase [Pseudodesulfovibrio senegalensis]KAB1443658.1 peptidoglycan DD-metalloendopeptidase family protein [Pseudodesulfovibrio senegalensis]